MFERLFCISFECSHKPTQPHILSCCETVVSRTFSLLITISKHNATYFSPLLSCSEIFVYSVREFPVYTGCVVKCISSIRKNMVAFRGRSLLACHSICICKSVPQTAAAAAFNWQLSEKYSHLRFFRITIIRWYEHVITRSLETCFVTTDLSTLKE